MNKTASIIITAALLVSLGIVFFGQSNNYSIPKEALSAQNVTVSDGVQYVTILARGGYSPRVSTAEANIPTKLVMKTDGTYDCSASLVIRTLGYQKILPAVGEEVIDLGTRAAGEVIQGGCSMGMYSFVIRFE